MPDKVEQAVAQVVASIRDAAPGRMSLQEFVDSGMLQEANRLFFHPRGLALAVTFTEEGAMLLGPILTTDDHEGWEFGASALVKQTLEAARRYEYCREAREARFGPGGIEPASGFEAPIDLSRDAIVGEEG